ncbi:MAG: hypothetical protein Kow00124_06850 [Anaerolineae bacterium]
MIGRWSPHINRPLEIALVIGVTLLAFTLRAAAHDRAPLGWRDDELSNALVVSQHVLDGDVRLYYDDASGHEGLYHWLQAGALKLFGPGVWGIRGTSIMLGTAAVTLTYLLVRRMYGWPAALIAALALAVSFWSLMYSRSGQRHISVTVTTLLAFMALWRGVSQAAEGPAAPRPFPWWPFAAAGLWMGLGFYTYFASRGLPLIIAAWAVYLLIWSRDLWRRVWRGLAVTLGVGVVLAVPLAVMLARQPEAEARVSELATPIYDALEGDFSTLGGYALTTLSMFTHDGDDEVLYNVANRPVFGPLGGLLFWVGVAIAVVEALGPARDPRAALLLLWTAAGLTPGMLSVPAASLGHTILAQAPAMVFPALALTRAADWLAGQPADGMRQAGAAVLTAAALFLSLETWRGIYDYFVVWPSDPFVRVLHYSDLYEASAWLRQHAETRDLAIGGFLVERWDQQAARLSLGQDGWRIRAFNPERAYPLISDGVAAVPAHFAGGWGVGGLGARLSGADAPGIYVLNGPGDLAAAAPLAAFENGLTLLSVTVGEGDSSAAVLELVTTWRVDRPLDLPPYPLFSKPPAPGEDDTPRLAIFVQLLDAGGARLTGDDGLGVDPYTLRPGDVFVQRHLIPLDGLPPGDHRLVIGLYNPASGQRVPNSLTGQDRFDYGVRSVP